MNCKLPCTLKSFILLQLIPGYPVFQAEDSFFSHIGVLQCQWSRYLPHSLVISDAQSSASLYTNVKLNLRDRVLVKE